MNKKAYITPMLQAITLSQELPVAASNQIDGNSINLNSGTMSSGSGEDATKSNDWDIW